MFSTASFAFFVAMLRCWRSTGRYFQTRAIWFFFCVMCVWAPEQTLRPPADSIICTKSFAEKSVLPARFDPKTWIFVTACSKPSRLRIRSANSSASSAVDILTCCRS